jgi:hypothetical protein
VPCQKTPDCPTGCVEQNNGHLSAQRFEAGSDLDKLNLALLGMTQRKGVLNARWNKLSRLTLEFENAEGK